MLRKGEIRRRGGRKGIEQRNIRVSKYYIRIMEGNKGTKVSNRLHFTF
jgi:hypothetical protein